MDAMVTIKHVVLDRDGVLNEEAANRGFISSPKNFRWLPGALEALKGLHRAGLRLSVATNQSGVGRGMMTVEQVETVNAAMRYQALKHGAVVDAVFFCPHAPEAGCGCRKPQPGLIEEAIATARIPAQETLVVGDDLRDIEAGQRAGVAVALVLTGKGRSNESAARERGVAIYDDLPAVMRAILKHRIMSPEKSMMRINQVFADHAAVIGRAEAELPPLIEQIVTLIDRCLREGHKVIACGNGGSAADAQHLVAELVGRFCDERRALAAVTLMADTATLTALANDYGYERVFARQIEALAAPGDVLIAISTSGNSANVVRAAEAARAAGCVVVGFTGASGGKLADHADPVLRAPSSVVARIQEVHALCIHAIADALDARILAASGS
jgi:D-sedoheptulose 7-phosphate isomerase